MIQQPDTDEATEKTILLDEKGKTEQPYRTTWIFEIFHDETVNGIHQIEINGSENRSKFIGTPKGKAVRIELMDGEEVQKLQFSGLN